jgi:aspartate/methionine/tyrosine aminotransferase
MKDFALEKWFGKYEFAVETDIGSSCIRPFGLAEFLKETGAQFPTDVSLGYRDSKGSLSLRQTIASRYEGATEDNVLITIGASEANYLALRVLAQEVPSAVIQFPAYQQLYEVLLSAGVDVSRWQMSIQNGYRPEAAEAGTMLGQGALLVITNPHNPTGALLEAEDLNCLHSAVAARDGWLYSDEVYSGLALAGQPRPVTAWRDNGRTICIGSMSKSYGLAGSRIGWMVGPRHIVQQCWGLRDYVSICPPALSEWLAETALERGAEIEARNRSIIDANLATVTEMLPLLGPKFEFVPPRAGVLAFPRINTEMTTWELCSLLAEEDSVLLVPGEVFERPGHVRLGLGGDPEALRHGLKVLARRLV